MHQEVLLSYSFKLTAENFVIMVCYLHVHDIFSEKAHMVFQYFVCKQQIIISACVPFQICGVTRLKSRYPKYVISSSKPAKRRGVVLVCESQL